MSMWARCAIVGLSALALFRVETRATPFVAGFETTNTPSYVAGQQLHVAGGAPYTWNWSGDNIGTISTAPAAVHAGAQGLDATRSSTVNSQSWWTRTNAFALVEDGVLTLNVAARATGWGPTQSSFLEIAASNVSADNFGANGTRSGWVTLKGDGKLYAWNGSGTESVVASGLDVTTWQEIRLDIDLDQNLYDVFLNGSPVASDFAFFGAGVSSVTSVQFKEYNAGASSGGVYLDDVSVSVVPEPSLLSLVALGALGLMLRWGRRALA